MGYDPNNPNYRAGPGVPGSPQFMPPGSGIGSGLPPARGYQPAPFPALAPPYRTPERGMMSLPPAFRPMGFSSEQPVFPDFTKAPALGGGEPAPEKQGVLSKIGGAITNPNNVPMWALLLGTGLQAYGAHQEGRFREKQAAEEKRRFDDRRGRAKTYAAELEAKLAQLRAQPTPQHSSPYL